MAFSVWETLMLALLIWTMSCFAVPHNQPICYSASEKGSKCTTFERTECNTGNYAFKFKSDEEFIISELLASKIHDAFPGDDQTTMAVISGTAESPSYPTRDKEEEFTAMSQRVIFSSTTNTQGKTITPETTQIFQVITENISQVLSPNFPANYDNNMLFWVSIRPPDKLSRVSLVFHDFDVENSSDCTADSVLILGTKNPHPICGSTIPSPIVSLGNIVEIYFKSNSNTSGSGLWADVYFMDPDVEYRTPAPGLCESVYVESNTTESFTSPNNGYSYYRNIQCGYIIHTDVGKTIELSFVWLGLENCASRADNEDLASMISSYDIPNTILGVEHEIDVESCPCDSLQVFDGFDEKAPHLTDRLCSWYKDIGTISSTGNVMYLYLETDNDVRTGGFSARVNAV